MSADVLHRIVLARRPSGLPAPEDFRLETAPLPEPADGEVLLRTRYLSIDPYMRQLMDAKGPVYAPSVDVGAVMAGGTVAEVLHSRHPAFAPGQLVLATTGWQDHAVADGATLVRVPPMDRPSLALGGLGMTGFTAHVGVFDIGQPRAGETVVVSAATGAVGSMAGQFARIAGARVVGIAGGQDKCRHAVEVLGFDACLDRHAPALPERLAAACPAGIDVYVENVGGPVFDAVFPLLNLHARIPVIGTIAHYNDAAPPAGPDRLPHVMTMVLQKRLRVQGVVILDHAGEREAAFQREVQRWLAEGRLTVSEHLVQGLANAPAAFIDMLRGRHHGKTVVAM